MCENEEELQSYEPSPLMGFVMTFYVGESFRICGELLTMDDFKVRHAVYAGYSSDNKSRCAHKACWDKNLPQEQWAYPESSKES